MNQTDSPEALQTLKEMEARIANLKDRITKDQEELIRLNQERVAYIHKYTPILCQTQTDDLMRYLGVDDS